jgi:hypothetical protein
MHESLNIQVINPVDAYASNLHSNGHDCVRYASCAAKRWPDAVTNAHRLALAVNEVELWSVAGDAADGTSYSECAAGTGEVAELAHFTARVSGKCSTHNSMVTPGNLPVLIWSKNPRRPG